MIFPSCESTFSLGMAQRSKYKPDARLPKRKDRLWPIPAVQAMKSIRARPTATCDPKASSGGKILNVHLAGLSGPFGRKAKTVRIKDVK